MQTAVKDANGNYVGRFANYNLGATAPDGVTKIAATPMSYDWLNYALTAAATYKLTKQFGFTGDFTYITQHPKIENFAPATLPLTLTKFLYLWDVPEYITIMNG